jgi:hypothetical protein
MFEGATQAREAAAAPQAGWSWGLCATYGWDDPPGGAGGWEPPTRAEEGEQLVAALCGMAGAWADGARGSQERLAAADLLTRVARWAQSAAARQVAQAACDAAAEDGQDPGSVVEEHALRTQATSHEAKRLAGAGRAGLDYDAVRGAQDDGALRVESAAAIRSAASRLKDPAARARVVGAGLMVAAYATPGRVKTAVDALAARLDPEAFAEGHKEAKDGRHVKVVPRPHGMAELRAYGPAFEVRQVMAGVEEAARKAVVFDREAGVSRTAGQREFDLFAGAWRPPADGAPPRSTREVAAWPHLLVKADLAVLLGLSGEPGVLVGSGEPVPADKVRELARSATWQALVEDFGRVVALGEGVHPPGTVWEPGSWPAEALACGSYKPSGALRLLLEARDRGCVTPNCSAPARRCDTDHVVPWDPSRPAEGQTVAANLQCLCRKCHLLKTHHGWGYVRDPVTGSTTVTTPNGHTVTRPPPGTEER